MVALCDSEFCFLETDIELGQEAMDPNVILHEFTTVSDYEVEGNQAKYVGTHIIPPTELNMDAQQARLKGMNDKVELEKLKTQMDLLQRALEMERQKSRKLEEQLNEVNSSFIFAVSAIDLKWPMELWNYLKLINVELQLAQNPYYYNDGTSRPPAPGIGNSGDLAVMECQLQELERTLGERERAEGMLQKNLDCAMTAVQAMQEENLKLREYIHELENDLQFYTSQMQP
jgi:hypothetical protein